MIKEQIKYIKSKAETLLKNVYQQYGDFYYDDDLKEIINGLNLIIISIGGTDEP